MNKAREESEQWASTDYAQALAKGDALTPEERSKSHRRDGALHRAEQELIDEANLRVDVGKFTHYLLLDQKLRVGRLDGRFTGPDPDGLLDTPFYDPTGSQTLCLRLPPDLTTTCGPISATKWTCPTTVSPSRPSFGNWDWGSGHRTDFPDTATALRAALVKRSLPEGSGDGGLLRLGHAIFCRELHHGPSDLGPKFHDNISFATYDAGHMAICRWTV